MSDLPSDRKLRRIPQVREDAGRQGPVGDLVRDWPPRPAVLPDPADVRLARIVLVFGKWVQLLDSAVLALMTDAFVI